MQHVYVTQVSCKSVKVESESYYEFGRDGKSHIVGIHFTLQRLGLEEQCCDAYRGGIFLLEVGHEFLYCVAGVDYVLDNDYIATFKIF